MLKPHAAVDSPDDMILRLRQLQGCLADVRAELNELRCEKDQLHQTIRDQKTKINRLESSRIFQAKEINDLKRNLQILTCKI